MKCIFVRSENPESNPFADLSAVFDDSFLSFSYLHSSMTIAHHLIVPKYCVNNDDEKSHTSDSSKKWNTKKKCLFKIELRLHNGVNDIRPRGCEIWKYDWCLPSVDRTSTDNIIEMRQMPYASNEEYRIHISALLQNACGERTPKLKSSLWCISLERLTISRVCQFILLQLWRPKHGETHAACPRNGRFITSNKKRKVTFSKRAITQQAPKNETMMSSAVFVDFICCTVSQSGSELKFHKMTEFAENERQK